MADYNTTFLILIQLLASKPLASLTLLSLVIISLASYYAADPWKKPEAREKEQESGNVIHITANHAIAFGGIASLGLISMWTFPNALVYFSLVSFGLGGFFGLQGVLVAISRRLSLPFSGGLLETLLAGGIVIWWVLIRNSSEAWLLQNFLGGFIIALMLKVLKLPDLQISSILLITAFLYDIFWVFISPNFTSNGKSVMESAATGSGLTVHEQVPMVFRIPISDDPAHGYAMLGFGDIILPGMFLTLLREVDVRLKGYWLSLVPQSPMPPTPMVIVDDVEGETTEIIFDGEEEEENIYIYENNTVFVFNQSTNWGKNNIWHRSVSSLPSLWTYHFTGLIGYFIGLEMTFIAMILTQMGQPALLYLVPSILLPVLLLSIKRKEFHLIWYGKFWENDDDENTDYSRLPQQDEFMRQV
ncbi:17804_t:CDS:2 [Funneliformis geosporum]|uniref:5412_t:CDS:1 n=1 Tax=Funneliformis geosporum TaxID=1117311 RepID=A0A9W4SPM6_9GLOM|nr:17804_t:CDS:2 [Funneliformis geosporum]CAI2177046.1 5412_t:CDS:2 [Funneliformis geosporum]